MVRHHESTTHLSCTCGSSPCTGMGSATNSMDRTGRRDAFGLRAPNPTRMPKRSNSHYVIHLMPGSVLLPQWSVLTSELCSVIFLRRPAPIFTPNLVYQGCPSSDVDTICRPVLPPPGLFVASPSEPFLTRAASMPNSGLPALNPANSSDNFHATVIAAPMVKGSWISALSTNAVPITVVFGRFDAHIEPWGASPTTVHQYRDQHPGFLVSRIQRCIKSWNSTILNSAGSICMHGANPADAILCVHISQLEAFSGQSASVAVTLIRK
ncbi:hypothetical protein BU24DRAFT_31812 [Aaosphaeria arxii CBS 175.79]|uniref:Uncharacterized protein n=1 Tax=Aaosphaeria arxii CBS 175.79 TaxID=1450172 RepID=A0A6A5YA49_9PLEO|nr:uncharacterized protein BU24DRAFT_31812 [Aaosphaeria arxii CBS 175.79]KAF2021887.1 hypothetical protein BU24DRAFT_31812 [Aaosphaeria arxii CBS 175.79]